MLWRFAKAKIMDLSILFLVCLFQFHWFLFSFVNDTFSHTQPNLQSVPAYEHWFRSLIKLIVLWYFHIKKDWRLNQRKMWNFSHSLLYPHSIRSLAHRPWLWCLSTFLCVYLRVLLSLCSIQFDLFYFFNFQFNAKSSLKRCITNNILSTHEVAFYGYE